MDILQSYLSAVYKTISARNGSAYAKLLSLPLDPSRFTNDLLRIAEKAKRSDHTRLCNAILTDTVPSAAVVHYILALMSLSDGDFVMAYRHQNASYNAVLDYFSSKEEITTWVIPVLVRVSNDLRILAEKVDEMSGDVNYKYLRESLGVLTKGFTAVAKDRSPVSQPGSKKLAIFAVTNVLFKIYFRVNTLQLCGKLINVVEGPGGIMDNLELFPICDVAMYKYYIGRLKMFEDKYDEARDCLRFSLKYCPRDFVRNRQRILCSLVPTEMCLGVLPSREVSSVYGLHELYALGEATRKGDLKAFDQILQEHQSTFVKLGVFLVLEQAKTIAYRNLFKRLFVISNSTRLNLAAFQTVLRSECAVDLDLDEMECILANLIFQNKIKGYISHQKRFLIVSKADPFPIAAVVRKPSAY